MAETDARSAHPGRRPAARPSASTPRTNSTCPTSTPTLQERSASGISPSPPLWTPTPGVDLDLPASSGLGRFQALLPCDEAARRPGDAPSAAAGVPHGTGIPVRAGGGVVGVDAARRRVAGVVRTGVPVVAAQRRPADAPAVAAGVVGGAGVPVVAGRCVGRVDAAGARIASVVRADVAIVAVGREAADADSAAAPIIEGAGVPVVARGGVVRVGTPNGGVAAVVGAGVAV